MVAVLILSPRRTISHYKRKILSRICIDRHPVIPIVEGTAAPGSDFTATVGAVPAPINRTSSRRRSTIICDQRMPPNSRDADYSRRMRSARQRTDVIISHQTLQKQTWRRAGNLKIKKSKINSNQLQRRWLKLLFSRGCL